jgi:molybdopterin-guanine dinucleotide biosynthesis protein A
MARDWLPLSAAVLAGGKSSRMGTDKAMLPLVPQGPTLIELVLERLEGVSDDLTIVANDDRLTHLGARLVPDLYPGTGALGGIHAALMHARHEHCLVVACDMPFLNPLLLQAMARESRDYDVLVPLLPGKSRQRANGLVYQTLHAIYGQSCAPAIGDRLEQEKYQVIGFFDAVRVRPVEPDTIRRWDPELRSFFNANTPEALAAASEIAAGDWDGN